MANHKSAIKRIKQNEKRRARNYYYKSTLKTFEKKFAEALENKLAKAEIEPLYKKLVALYDKVAGKGIVHANRAARRVSKLTLVFNGLK